MQWCIPHPSLLHHAARLLLEEALPARRRDLMSCSGKRGETCIPTPKNYASRNALYNIPAPLYTQTPHSTPRYSPHTTVSSVALLTTPHYVSPYYITPSGSWPVTSKLTRSS